MGASLVARKQRGSQASGGMSGTVKVAAFSLTLSLFYTHTRARTCIQTHSSEATTALMYGWGKGGHEVRINNFVCVLGWGRGGGALSDGQ